MSARDDHETAILAISVVDGDPASQAGVWMALEGVVVLMKSLASSCWRLEIEHGLCPVSRSNEISHPIEDPLVQDVLQSKGARFRVWMSVRVDKPGIFGKYVIGFDIVVPAEIGMSLDMSGEGLADVINLCRSQEIGEDDHPVVVETGSRRLGGGDQVVGPRLHHCVCTTEIGELATGRKCPVLNCRLRGLF